MLRNKCFWLLAVLIALTGSASLTTAQVLTEDVIYMKDGSYYKGVIVEMVPDSFAIILTPASHQYTILAKDIDKVVKEPVSADRVRKFRRENHRVRAQLPDSLQRKFEYREKGYFFQAQIVTELMKIGFRFTNGYRFNQFVHLGFSIGIENILVTQLNKDLNGFNSSNYEGAIIPIHLYLQGDLSRKQAAAFYYAEIGYSATFRARLTGSGNAYREGGLSGGFGFGVKLSSKHRFKITLTAGLDIKSIRFSEQVYENGVSRTKITTGEMLFPGIRMSLGI